MYIHNIRVSLNHFPLYGRSTKRDRDLANSNNTVKALEDQVRNLNSKMNKLQDERESAEKELREALPELEALKKKLAELKRHLDDEQLKKADLENTCARLEEDLKFKMSVLEKELVEVKTRKEVEINEMDGKLQEEYEDRLQKALEELREVYDKQMAQSREDFAKLYDDRVRDLQQALTTERGNNASSAQERKEARSRIEHLISKSPTWRAPTSRSTRRSPTWRRTWRTRRAPTAPRWPPRTTRSSGCSTSWPTNSRSTRIYGTSRSSSTWRSPYSESSSSARRIVSAWEVRCEFDGDE